MLSVSARSPVDHTPKSHAAPEECVQPEEDGSALQYNIAAFSSRLTGGPTCDPQKDDSIVLQHLDVHLPHLIVGHGTVWQVLMDLPGGVGHDHPKLA